MHVICSFFFHADTDFYLFIWHITLNVFTFFSNNIRPVTESISVCLDFASKCLCKRSNFYIFRRHVPLWFIPSSQILVGLGYFGIFKRLHHALVFLFEYCSDLGSVSINSSWDYDLIFHYKKKAAYWYFLSSCFSFSIWTKIIKKFWQRITVGQCLKC